MFGRKNAFDQSGLLIILPMHERFSGARYNMHLRKVHRISTNVVPISGSWFLSLAEPPRGHPSVTGEYIEFSKDENI